MINIQEVHRLYTSVDIADLGSKQKKEMYAILSSVQPEELKTLTEHQMYVELLNIFRRSLLLDDELKGKNFKKQLAAFLTVGGDSIYSNQHRFIYELIQNVDDCDYKNVNDCHLDIQFCWHKSPAQIILTYNEIGFKPWNVFSITGIAEASKNVSADKVEIGEKGIGFKSVFGIANRVLIQSGMFSFELEKENFTVPFPRYEDDFTPVSGTKLILEMSSKECEDIYRSLVTEYVKSDALMKKNPILFLNKLTHLKMYFDGWCYIEFDVERKTPEKIGDLLFENNVKVSVDMKDSKNGSDKNVKNEILCTRYTQPIIYGQKECIARYTEDTAFEEKKHNLIAMFPINDKSEILKEGRLYSFLPTQVKLTAPIVMHVPFKLDGSREFVDDQNTNAWFMYTVNHLSEFLKKIYLHYATIVKKDIIQYIPGNGRFFFKRDNEKIACLQRDLLRANIIYNESVFFSEDGTYEKASDVVSFAINEELENPEIIFKLLGVRKKLFIPNEPINMAGYGVEVISNIFHQIFANGLENEHIFDSVAQVLDKQKEFDVANELNRFQEIHLTVNHLRIIAKYKRLYRGFSNYEKAEIRTKNLPKLYLDDSLHKLAVEQRNLINELVQTADLDTEFVKYLYRINFNLLALDNVKEDFFAAGENGIVLSKTSPLSSFGDLSESFDPRKTFSATLQIRQASDKLNEVEDDTMSNQEYLKLLRGVRRSLINAFGERMYSSYIQIINKSGSDKNRFLNELLQNADDCKYTSGVKPYFKLSSNGNILSVEYNEKGFTKANVRAITSIGESTKKLLLQGDDRTIGEKGVGFKSVFGVASAVDVHSNGFDFKLVDERPTVPDKCDSIGITNGTCMQFTMKTDIAKSLNKDRILQLCLCLRNLKDIKIQDTHIIIEDSEKERIISVNGTEYHFERFAYNFEVEDEEALEERAASYKEISRQQCIICYLPKEYKPQELFVYAGLPTIIQSNIPLIIDAPFELTTSRDFILENNWNSVIREHIFKAILSVMKEKRSDLGIDVLKLINIANEGNMYSLKNFELQYLNKVTWSTSLKQLKVLPLMCEDKCIAACDAACLIVPEIIAHINDKTDVSNYFNGKIINTRGKSQYVSLLKLLDCKEADLVHIIRCIEDNLGNSVEDEKFRKILYTYLANNQQEIQKIGMMDNVREFPIFPIRVSGGTRYVSYSSNIYTHSTEISNNEFLILDEKIMDYETSQKILGEHYRFNQLTQEVYEAKYKKKIEEMIKSKRRTSEIAEYLLNEFNRNFKNISKSQHSLKGLVKEIPMLMENGSYKRGNKFLNDKDLFFGGKEIVLPLIVSEKYEKFAAFLELDGVSMIHYDDIDLQLSEVSDDDLEDIQEYFENYVEIIVGLLEDGLISDEQIEKYNLQYYLSTVGESDYYDDDEDFPGRRVQNLEFLKNHIRGIWKNHRNPYITKTYTRREPKNPMNKEAYTQSIYQSQYNDNKCFCQMCQRAVNNKYIERNVLQKEPDFAWEQMYLSLCLNCSKDYVLLRNNTQIWNRFYDAMLDADVEEDEVVEIQMADKSIIFTATHLAEIQEILNAELEYTAVTEAPEANIGI